MIRFLFLNLYSILMQSDGKLLATGWNPFNIGNDVYTTIARFHSGLNLNVNEFNNESFVVYPNPSNGLFNIDLTEEEFDFNVISIHNLLGVSVYSSSIVSNEINQIDLSHLPSGYYIAKIASKDKSIQIKLVKK